MQMPAMSPTMTEGTVSEWKVKEGDSFVAGDVLVTIETDKASIDVEAQDDGIVGKILVSLHFLRFGRVSQVQLVAGEPLRLWLGARRPRGRCSRCTPLTASSLQVQDGTQNVQVGKLIAVLAEEGDDLSAIEVPSESSSTSASPAAPSPEPTPKAAEAPKAEITAPKPSPPANSPSKSQGAAATEGGHHDLPTHSRPLLPSVLRQLVLAGVTDTSKIKATGFKGQLSKGDVLAHLGLIKSANGSLKEAASHGAKPAAKTEVRYSRRRIDNVCC